MSTRARRRLALRLASVHVPKAVEYGRPLEPLEHLAQRRAAHPPAPEGRPLEKEDTPARAYVSSDRRLLRMPAPLSLPPPTMSSTPRGGVCVQSKLPAIRRPPKAR